MSIPFPPLASERRNQYLLMRHGHSEANRQGRIVSDPARGIDDFGLSARGQAQLDALLNNWPLAVPSRIVHSDFLRTAQTAARVAQRFGLDMQGEPRLRERCFGKLEGESDRRYAEVWVRDAQAADHRDHGVEPLTSVAARMLELLGELESRYRDETLLLVGHGDPLQILLAELAGDVRRHREREPLAPAALVRL
ncbi:MAG TPA: histidine phosphatase family protein [Halomonas sp.]|nr:histidine phosphatase family protein [Halomonas sp.]